MNSYFGWAIPDGSFNSASRRAFYKMSDVSVADPTKLFVFLDVGPASLCYSGFVVVMGDTGWFYHLPSGEHANSGVLTFADGHAESHRWRAPDTLDASRHTDSAGSHFRFFPGNVDLIWLQEHATVPK